MPTQSQQTSRKSKFNPQIQVALCRWLKKGCSYKDTCAMEENQLRNLPHVGEGEICVFCGSKKTEKVDCAAKNAKWQT